MPLQNQSFSSPYEVEGIKGVRLMVDIEETCRVCGYASHLGAVAKHHLIPKNVTKEAGMRESETISLCNNCHFELQNWYRTKVVDMVYDPGIKRFRAKSWDEKVKEYQYAFNDFLKYKNEQKKIRLGKQE